MTRILAIADLHFGRSGEADLATTQLAKAACQIDADAVVIAGDVAIADPRKVVECLELFSEFSGAKLVVPGNHDLWTKRFDSWRIWNRLFPESAKLAGFHCLDRAPFTLGGCAFVGSVGWYDYSFADPALGAPLWQYISKTYRRWQWNDVNFIKWDHTDQSFTNAAVEILDEHIEQVRSDVDTIVAVTHHLPFAELITHRDDREWTFGNAFMGSQRFGRLLSAEPKVAALICGHSHDRVHTQVGHITALNVGSTYTQKRLDVLDVDADQVRLVETISFPA